MFSKQKCLCRVSQNYFLWCLPCFLYGSLIIPLNNKKVIATFYPTTFYLYLFLKILRVNLAIHFIYLFSLIMQIINSRFHVITSELWDINLQFWRLYLAFQFVLLAVKKKSRKVKGFFENMSIHLTILSQFLPTVGFIMLFWF